MISLIVFLFALWKREQSKSNNKNTEYKTKIVSEKESEERLSYGRPIYTHEKRKVPFYTLILLSQSWDYIQIKHNAYLFVK